MSAVSPQQNNYFNLIKIAYQKMGLSPPVDSAKKTHIVKLPDGGEMYLDHYPENWLIINYNIDVPPALSLESALDILQCNLNFIDNPGIVFGADPERKVFIVWSKVNISTTDGVEVSDLLERFLITLDTVKQWIHSTAPRTVAPDKPKMAEPLSLSTMTYDKLTRTSR